MAFLTRHELSPNHAYAVRDIDPAGVVALHDPSGKAEHTSIPFDVFKEAFVRIYWSELPEEPDANEQRRP